MEAIQTNRHEMCSIDATKTIVGIERPQRRCARGIRTGCTAHDLVHDGADRHRTNDHGKTIAGDGIA